LFCVKLEILCNCYKSNVFTSILVKIKDFHLSSLEGLVQHDSQTNGRKSVKDDCPDDHAGVGSLKTEDVSVTKEWQEERKDGDGGDQVEEEVDPGEAK